MKDRRCGNPQLLADIVEREREQVLIRYLWEGPGQSAAAAPCLKEVAGPYGGFEVGLHKDRGDREESHPRVGELRNREGQIGGLSRFIHAVAAQNVPEVMLIADTLTEKLPIGVDLDLLVMFEPFSSGLACFSQARGGNPTALHEIQIDAAERTGGHLLQGFAVREGREQVGFLGQ